MKRVKGVEHLNICIIGAQGIVGVGATILTPIASYRVGASRQTASVGSPAGLDLFFAFACSRACSRSCFSRV
jgi:hypothetical protein